jgi:hypothetical protein
MHWPQITMIALLSIGLLGRAHSHGKPGGGSFWVALFSTALLLTLLVFGGFFSH